MAGRQRRALCIGIDSYRRKPLRGCVNDARIWEGFLGDKADFNDVQVLLNGDAEKDAIIQGIENLLKQGTAGDVLVVTYAGHGAHFVTDRSNDERDGIDEALVPVNSSRGHILDDHIGNLVDAHLKTDVNLTFVFDCCHSQSISRGFGGRDGRAGTSTGLTRFLEPDDEMKEAYAKFDEDVVSTRGGATRGGNREIVFSACKDSEKAAERTWNRRHHGRFTVACMRALQARTGIAGLSNERFLRDVLVKFGSGGDQTPKLTCDDGFLSSAFLGSFAAGSAVVDVDDDDDDDTTADPGGIDAKTEDELISEINASLALLTARRRRRRRR